jgi:hypothetical protein
MPNFIQQSILRTRLLVGAINKRRALNNKRAKEDAERGNTQLELMIDEISAETGLSTADKKDWPAIAMHVEQVLMDAKRRKEESEQEPDGDVGGMKDFPL